MSDRKRNNELNEQERCRDEGLSLLGKFEDQALVVASAVGRIVAARVAMDAPSFGYHQAAHAREYDRACDDFSRALGRLVYRAAQAATVNKTLVDL